MASKNAKQLLADAIVNKVGKNSPGYRDQKAYCSTEDISTLLNSGAAIVFLNSEMVGGKYVHEVSYGGHKFQCVTEGQVETLKEYIKKH